MNPLTRHAKLEDTAVTILGRIVGQTGAAITQATISSITVRIRRVDSGASSPTTETLNPTVSAVVYDTLQTSDARWTDDEGVQLDADGFNFAYLIPKTSFTEGPGVYNVDVTFTPTSGATSDFAHVWQFDTIKRWNS